MIYSNRSASGDLSKGRVSGGNGEEIIFVFVFGFVIISIGQAEHENRKNQYLADNY